MKIIIIALICIVAFAIFRLSKKKSEKEAVSQATEKTSKDETETKSVDNNAPSENFDDTETEQYKKDIDASYNIFHGRTDD